MGPCLGEVSSMCANIWQEGVKNREPNSSHPTDRTRENGHKLKHVLSLAQVLYSLLGWTRYPLPQCWSGCQGRLSSPLVSPQDTEPNDPLVCPHKEYPSVPSVLRQAFLFFFFTISGDHYLYTPRDYYSFGHLLWSFFCCQRVWISYSGWRSKKLNSKEE